ncbi:MAG: DMT family transporter [Neomegalonema sp.]|nr:DMT family transporter [Neomegalonema sp.]
MNRPTATAIGFGAVLLWATLAALTDLAKPTPPFLLNAISFLIGGMIGVGYLAVRAKTEGRNAIRIALRQPAHIWAIGVIGLFGYHFFYFTALRNAPVAEASLIAYLWPLLIVLFSTFLPGEGLRRGHVAGALCGLAGALILLAGSDGFSLSGDGGVLGYAAAIICALTWSSYSVLSRAVGEAPTMSVAGFCIVAAALSVLCHLMFEETAWPQGIAGWIGAVGLGVGPVGLSFYLWDIGCKHGDIQLLGVLAYGAPLLSTLLLISIGSAAVTASLFIGLILILSGSFLAARASLQKQSTASTEPS